MVHELNNLWKEHIRDHSSCNPSGWLQDELDYEPVASEIVGESRWGIFYEKVFKASDGSLIGVDYEDAAAEGDYDAEMMNAEFYAVEPETVTVVKYVRK